MTSGVEWIFKVDNDHNHISESATMWFKYKTVFQSDHHKPLGVRNADLVKPVMSVRIGQDLSKQML